MHEEHRDIIAKTFAEVLERQVFMFADPAGPEEFRDGKSRYLLARMSFSGPMDGSLSLAAPEALLPEFTSNFLGMEPEDDAMEERSRDALMELLNMVCGRMLTAIAGESPVFDLSVPEASFISAPEAAGLAGGPDALRFMVEDEPVFLLPSFRGRGVPPGPAAAES